MQIQDRLQTLHEVLADFYRRTSPIKYKYYSPHAGKEVERERPTSEGDIDLLYMFDQSWGSTALGHGGMGGNAITSAPTIVIKYHREFFVYFGRRLAYQVNEPNDLFHQDLRAHGMKARRHASKYLC